MKLIDSEVIAVRLRATLENLFETSNQAVFLGLIHPYIASLTLQMSNRH